MSDLTATIRNIYAAFGRGDIDTILDAMTEDVLWEFEAPSEISWSGIRRGREQAAGFFAGIAAEHADPKLEMTEFFEAGDAVAVFGRYAATIRATGIRVDSPVAHYFRFRDGKIARYVNVIDSGSFVEAMRGNRARSSAV